ncbi:hypothetical protein [Nitrospira sp. M1]
MATRTMRLDDKAEKVLQEVVPKTGLSISDTFKNGILALRDAISDQPLQSPYDVYQKLYRAWWIFESSLYANTSRGTRRHQAKT